MSSCMITLLEYIITIGEFNKRKLLHYDYIYFNPLTVFWIKYEICYYAPTTLDHWAGGLHSGYCLGNSFLLQFVRNITLYNTRRFELHSDDMTAQKGLNPFTSHIPAITLRSNRRKMYSFIFMVFPCFS